MTRHSKEIAPLPLYCWCLLLYVLLAAGIAEAVPLKFDIASGSMGGSFLPADGRNKLLPFDAAISGSFTYDESKRQATIDITYSGTLYGDWFIGSDTGSLSGSLSYVWSGLEHWTDAHGHEFIIATPDKPAPLRPASLSASLAGFTDTESFRVMAKPVHPADLPEGTFLLLTGIEDGSPKLSTWLSGALSLQLGHKRSGDYTMAFDLDAYLRPASPPPQPIPEPGTAALVAAGLAAAAGRHRRRAFSIQSL